VSVEKYLLATSQIAQTTLRSVLGKADLDMLLGEREQLNEALQQIIDEHTDPWGIKVTTVEIKDVEIPQQMQHAMALGAQAERERRAKIIHAEGEFQASERLRDAADVISGNPASLQLRYLQTLTEIGANQNSTVVFPLPLDVIKPFVEALQPADQRAVNRSPESETISSSRSPSLTRPEPAGDQRSVVAAGRSDGPGP
jgi:regulator of protease activity HflC (stomatin/prohibitin superfamily)